MEKTDYIERLAAIKARYGNWNDDDRTELKAMVKELGINHSFRGKCSSCYNDAFHLIMHHLELKAADLEHGNKQSSGKWVYVGCIPVTWYCNNGTFVLDENTPDEIVERYIAAFPKQKKFELNKKTDMNINFIGKPNAVHTVLADAGVQPIPAGLNESYNFISYGDDEGTEELATGIASVTGNDSENYFEIIVDSNSVEGFIGNRYWVSKNATYGSDNLYQLYNDGEGEEGTGMYVKISLINTSNVIPQRGESEEVVEEQVDEPQTEEVEPQTEEEVVEPQTETPTEQE